jgi:hypothetical protein
MFKKLPLDSPLWAELDAAGSSARVVECLREITATRQLGDAWDDAKDLIYHQNSVYDATSAALPHVIEVAAALPAEDLSSFWIDVGLLVAEGAGWYPKEPAPGLQWGLTAALRVAERLAVRSFLAKPAGDPTESSDHALACVALAGHDAGSVLPEWLRPIDGYVQVECPRCYADQEIDCFDDPIQPPCESPAVPSLASSARVDHPWAEVAAALEEAQRIAALGPGWDPFFRTAAAVAAAGVPAHTPRPAALCLVGAMVAVGGAAEWSRTLLRLVGHFRCGSCDQVWAFGDALGELGKRARVAPSPVPEAALDLATVADSSLGFKPPPQSSGAGRPRRAAARPQPRPTARRPLGTRGRR